jgi:hypothetical protein
MNRPGVDERSTVEHAEHLLNGAKFKDTPQASQLENLLNILRDIHQLEPDGVSPSPCSHAQQDSQSSRINALNLRQVEN